MTPLTVAQQRNPFSTRFTRPGALEYRFAAGATFDDLVERIIAQARWGAIVGPHGSGKSTLLAGLMPRLAAAGYPCFLITLRDGQRRVPDMPSRSVCESTAIVVVDGYEQLSWWSRRRLNRFGRRRGLGLLVTAHDACDLPLVLRTSTDLGRATALVDELLKSCALEIDSGEIARCYAQHGGNLREMLFGLYDLYERQRICGCGS